MKKVLFMVLAIVSLLVFNSKIEANELDVIDEYRNALIIRYFIDVESLIREDEEKNNRKYNEIPETLKMLSDNPVDELVSGYFRKKGYKLSLMFFNHSLVDNPSDIKIDLIDKNYGIESYIKSLLKEDDIFDKMKNFSNKNNEYETLSDSDYAFENGDLALAIHGFTWKRTRAKYSKAYFKIIDTYDFDPKSLQEKNMIERIGSKRDGNWIVMG